VKEQKNSPKLRFPEFKGEWERKKLGEVAEKITDGTHDTPKPILIGVPFLTAIHIKDGYIDYNNCYYLEQEVHNSIYKRCNPEKDDLLIVNIGAGTATCALNTVDYEFSLKNVALVKPNRALIDGKFLAQIQRKKAKKIFTRLTSGGAQPFLSLNEIRKLQISFPSLPEQKRIASFFTALDQKIAELKQKKNLLENYKKGVMQKLFSRALRFQDENGKEHSDWEKKKLGEVLEEKNEKTKTTGQHKILSSTTKGLFNQDEYFTRDIASKDNSGYKILRKYQLVFSPQNLWLGNINVNMSFDIGIVSPSYKIFSFIEKYTHAQYCQYFLLLPQMMFEYEQSSVQGASVVRRNLDLDRFLNIEIYLPCLKEQTKIANFLTALDEKINHTENQLQQTQAYKKGLLQKMFV
jgi:type I restriction enzyme S subunit